MIQEAEVIDGIPGYDEEARALYAGGLSEDPGEEIKIPDVE